MLHRVKQVGTRILSRLGLASRQLNGSGVSESDRYGLYDKQREIAVPIGHAIYDPQVFGRYDLASQRVVSKESRTVPDLVNWDLLMMEAQRHARNTAVAVESDRYPLVLSYLKPGRGICLDACTNHPLSWVRDRISGLGYHYLPIDLNGDGRAVRVEDLTRLSLSEGSVARILSLDTLEHIEDYRRALAELYRVLEPNGLALFHVPCYYVEKGESVPIRAGVDPWGHVRYFSAKELVQDLAEAGFILLRVNLHFDYGAVLCVVTKDPSIVQGILGR
jgi:SAM-dependent methyltransferase